jgi:hypothetical protein
MPDADPSPSPCELSATADPTVNCFTYLTGRRDLDMFQVAEFKQPWLVVRAPCECSSWLTT